MIISRTLGDTERCVNDVCGFCDQGQELIIENCPFGKKDEHGVIHCVATPENLIEVYDECLSCDTREFDEDYCPVDSPDECPLSPIPTSEVKPQ